MKKVDLVLQELENGSILNSRMATASMNIKRKTFHRCIEILRNEGYEIRQFQLDLQQIGPGRPIVNYVLKTN
jgi:hypothetical protein